MTKLDEMTYGELTGQAMKIMVEIRRRAYREGYEQGQLAEREINSCKGEKGFELGEEIGDKLTQIKRDKIVERAKDDVMGLTRYRDTTHYGDEGLSYGALVVREEFIVNKEKRTVVCLLKGSSRPKVYSRGIAKCAPNDCFNVHIGKAIALRRALGLDVPVEYLNAPQPTEVRVGDIVNLNGATEMEVFQPAIKAVQRRINSGVDKIIDDSREEEGA